MYQSDDLPRLTPFRLALVGGALMILGAAVLYFTYGTEGDNFLRFAYSLSLLFYGIPIYAGVVCFVTLGIAIWPRKPVPNVTNSVTSETESKRPSVNAIIEAEWRDFYQDVACLSADNGNGLGRVRVFGQQLTDAQWRDCIREPLVEAKVAIRKNTVGGETALWASGWSPEKFSGWLVTNLPTHPSGHPPKLDRAVRQDKNYSENTGNYKDGQPDTVSAA